MFVCVFVFVYPLAGPIKWNRPSATIWSVFQNPVTYIIKCVLSYNLDYSMPFGYMINENIRIYVNPYGSLKLEELS